MRPRIVVVGDALLDVEIEGTASRLTPDAPAPVVDVTGESVRPGGAGLTALFARRDGAEVTLVSGVGADRDGRRLRDELDRPGIGVVALPMDGATPVKRRVRVAAHSLVRLDNRPGTVATDLGGHSERVQDLVRDADVVIAADYGRGTVAHPQVRDALAGSSSVVWDPHPRGCVPVAGARVVLPNAAEAAGFTGGGPGTRGAWAGAGRAADQLVRSWRVGAVCVTMGDQGALLSYGSGPPVVIPTSPEPGDPCGAGDRFTAAVATALAGGAVLVEAIQAAVAAAADHVRHGFTTPEAAAIGQSDPIARVRASGGTVVATGGCFDLLHAGHIAVLTQARALGDCLVVAVNSDASVARIKGPSRPVVPLADRLRVLESLACVDAAVPFDADTPDELLRRWRPDVWVKGGDYTAGDLPEAAVVASWGGEAVTVPYLSGRSTTSLVTRMQRSFPDPVPATEEES